MSAAALRQMADEAGLPPEVLQQALEWLVTVWSREAAEADLLALERWRAASAEHERAWQQVQRLDGRMAVLPPAAGTSLRAVRRTSERRRQVLRAFVALAAGGVVFHATHDSRIVRTRLADLRTAPGEVRALTLEDGTRIILDTRTALDLRYAATERRLRLIDGEVLIATAPDAAPQPRPFVVETAHGIARPVGTRFTVRSGGARSTVAVYEGAVEVRPHRGGGEALRLEHGQQASFSAAALEPVVAADETRAAWSRGLLVVERWPLADFLRELNRYRGGVIRCDPAVAGLVVSGTFPLADTGRVLDALPRALPVRVRSRSRFWVVVEPA